MESNKIGTDASIPQHIQNIIDRGYVQVSTAQRLLDPTNLGIALARCYYAIDPDLVQPTVRASIEEMVNSIAKVYRKIASCDREKLIMRKYSTRLLECSKKSTKCLRPKSIS